MDEIVHQGVFYTVKGDVATDEGIVDSLTNDQVMQDLVKHGVIKDMRITKEMLKKSE